MGGGGGEKEGRRQERVGGTEGEVLLLRSENAEEKNGQEARHQKTPNSGFDTGNRQHRNNLSQSHTQRGWIGKGGLDRTPCREDSGEGGAM